MKKILLIFILIITVGCSGMDSYSKNINTIKSEVNKLELSDEAKTYYEKELDKIYEEKKDEDIDKFENETKEIYRQAFEYGVNYQQLLDKIWIHKYEMTNITGYNNDGQDGFLLSTIVKKDSDGYLAQGDGRIFGTFTNENMHWTLEYNGKLTITYAKNEKTYLIAKGFEIVENKYLVLDVTKFKNKKYKGQKQFRLADENEFNQSEEESFIK